jgi:hypothetical protein
MEAGLMKDLPEDMHEEILEHNSNALVLSGHTNAIIGLASQYGRPPLVLYDPVKVIDNLVLEGMSHDEAVEFFEYNIACAYRGANTPMMLIRLETLGVSNDSDVEEGNT